MGTFQLILRRPAFSAPAEAIPVAFSAPTPTHHIGAINSECPMCVHGYQLQALKRHVNHR